MVGIGKVFCWKRLSSSDLPKFWQRRLSQKSAVQLSQVFGDLGGVGRVFCLKRHTYFKLSQGVEIISGRLEEPAFVSNVTSATFPSVWKLWGWMYVYVLSMWIRFQPSTLLYTHYINNDTLITFWRIQLILSLVILYYLIITSSQTDCLS